MDDRYYINADYKCNPPFKYDSEDFKKSNYWTAEQIKRNYYTAYYVYKKAIEIIAKNNINNILDLGAGIGVKSNMLYEKTKTSITCIDSHGALKICRKYFGNGNYIPVNLEEIDVELIDYKEKFDLIICSEVIEHLEKPEKLLNFIRSVSNENTIILISTPERNNTRGKNMRYSPNPYHVREWNMNEFYMFITNSNYEVISHILIPPIKPFISLYFLKQLFYSILTFKKYIFKGTQLVICKTK